MHQKRLDGENYNSSQHRWTSSDDFVPIFESNDYQMRERSDPNELHSYGDFRSVYE